MARSLSLVVPSGSLTLGNLLGAIQHWVADQRGADTLYGLADMHALTTPHDPAAVRAATLEQATLLLAAGLDPRPLHAVRAEPRARARRAALAARGDRLRRGVAPDDPVQGEVGAVMQTVRAALLTYPVLMAADVLLYDVATVPVGDDQRQHLELARDLALRFNRGLRPDVHGAAHGHPRGGRAGHGPAGSVGQDEQVGAAAGGRGHPAARSARRGAAQDRAGGHRQRPAAGARGRARRRVWPTWYTILAACTGETAEQAAANAGSYRELKQALPRSGHRRLAPLQARYAALADNPQAVTRALREGAERARSLASGTLARAKTAIGLLAP